MVFAIVTIFALAVLLVLRVTWWRTPREDDPVPPIPNPIDPIELAYLRRGPGDAVRSVAVALAARGIVRIDGDLLAQTGVPLPSRDDPFENAVYDALRVPRTFAKLVETAEFSLRAALEPLDARVREAGLLRRPVAPGIRNVGLVAFLVGTVVAAPLANAVGKRDGFGAACLFLVSFAALGIVGLATILRPRLTARGKRYLAQFRMGFAAENLRTTMWDERVAAASPNGGAAPAVALGGAAFAAPLLVGLYGVSALAMTPFSNAALAMRPPRRTGSSGGCGGCGTGWGGGCGSCGGCGGSGCGSGGCGGCGGGCGS